MNSEIEHYLRYLSTILPHQEFKRFGLVIFGTIGLAFMIRQTSHVIAYNRLLYVLSDCASDPSWTAVLLGISTLRDKQIVYHSNLHMTCKRLIPTTPGPGSG